MRNLSRLAGAVCALVLTSTTLSAQVPNDDCSGALPVTTGLNGPFSNVGASASPTPWTCGFGVGADVWFTYTAVQGGVVSFNTCTGTGFDTVLEAFDGTCAALNLLACNDDNCGLQSGVSFPAQAGQTFYVRVGGYNGATGSFQLDVAEIPAQSNDECTGAVPVTIGLNGPYSSLSATTSQPPWACASGGNDVWFSFTALCNQTVTADTCTGSTFDTAIELFDGSCTGLNWRDCNDDSCGLQSSVTFQALAGTTYYIRVGGFSGAVGTFNLELSVSGSGTFATASPGCGATSLSATGSPNIGGGVAYTMNNVVGTPLMWVGAVPLNAPLCSAGCNIGTTFDIMIAGGSISGPIPCAPYMVGATYYVQGADLGASGGCPAGQPGPVPMTTTETIVTTIG